MIAYISIAILFLIIISVVLLARRDHGKLDGMSCCDMADPGMLTATLAFQLGKQVSCNQDDNGQWTIETDDGIRGTGPTPIKAHEDFMDKYKDGKCL